MYRTVTCQEYIECPKDIVQYLEITPHDFQGVGISKQCIKMVDKMGYVYVGLMERNSTQI
jgi:hypothetical protein